MKKYLSFILLFVTFTLQAQETYKTVKDIPYVPAGETDGYCKGRCELDVYYPVGKEDFPTIVWFRDGGLEEGGKHIPEMFMNQGFAVVAVNYRFGPKVKDPAHTDDAATAVAQTCKRIEEYGGNPKRAFVTGHSAGGYLTSMVGLGKSYPWRYGVDADSIAAYLPINGQTVTHFTIRKEHALPEGIPVIDRHAPCNKARKNIPPFILITGNRNLKMADRYEENALLASVLKSTDNQRVSLYELQGSNHEQVYTPGCCLVVSYIRRSTVPGM